MSGKSRSAESRRRMKEQDPEKYAELLRKQKLRYHERKRLREQHWASGTRQALDDKAAYYDKKRSVSRKHELKKRLEGSRSTRNSRIEVVDSGPRVQRKLMSPEERKEHDKMVRTSWIASKSRQRRTADKAAHARYMREWRRGKALSVSGLSAAPHQSSPVSTKTATPLTPSTPSLSLTPTLACNGPSTSTPVQPLTRPGLKRNQGAVNLLRDPPAQKDKMRQHCYNTCSKVKSMLKTSFSSEEVASMTTNLVLRRTPQKKKENLDRLLENPEVRAYCRQRLVFETPSRKRKVPSGPSQSHTSQRLRAKKARIEQTRHDIQKFYTNPAVSRVLPHRRYATKRGPGYVLMVTLQSAYEAYQKFSGKNVSFSTFAGLRPKNVRRLGSVPVDTCLCVTCTNVKLKIATINRLPSLSQQQIPEGRLFQILVCPYKGEWPRKACITGDCLRCQDRLRPFTLRCWQDFFSSVRWFHWERRAVEGRMKLDLHTYHGSVSDMLEQLNKDLTCPIKGTSFIQHLFTAYWQQSQYEASKHCLQQGQVILVQDFAENRKATYTAEVKSAHFGKAQVTLHPTVAFYRDSFGQLIRHVLMFFSDDIGHDYHAVHCYTEKAVEILRGETSVERGVILWSDGAASQYKGKGAFADLSLYPFPVQRNFFGSEHGKGEADGETGRFSQAMSRAVAGGHFFRNARDMVDFGSSKYESTGMKKYSFILVDKDEIQRNRPQTDVSTLPGSRSMHQFCRKGRYILATRKLSCFCSGCTAGQFDCCIHKEYVDAFEVFKLKPSNLPETENDPLSSSSSLSEPEEPVFTRSEYPPVGSWIEVIGSVQVKKTRQDKRFYANVVPPPEGNAGGHFFAQFFQGTASGSFVRNTRVYQIVPGTPENYRWRIVAAPMTNARGHFFFTN